MRNLVGALIVSLGTSAIVFAHVEMRPQVSAPASDQQYTLRAHNESNVAVTSVTLDVPTEVTVADVPKPTIGSFDVKKDGSRIVSITWTREIKPATFADFRFNARNPAKGTDIQWHAREQMADGTSIDWGGTSAGAKKGPVTRLNAAGARAPAAADHEHSHSH